MVSVQVVAYRHDPRSPRHRLSPSATVCHLQRASESRKLVKVKESTAGASILHFLLCSTTFFFLLSFDFLPSAAAITTGKWLHHGVATKNKFVPLAIYGHQYSRCSSEWLIGRDRSCTQSHAAHVLSPSTVQSLISDGRVGFSDRPRRKLIIQPLEKKKRRQGGKKREE